MRYKILYGDRSVGIGKVHSKGARIGWISYLEVRCACEVNHCKSLTI